MSPLSVVEELEVVEELGARRSPRGPFGVVDEFDLHRREKALGDGVVPAVAPTAHAADDPMLRQPPLVVAAGVLTAAIGMMHQPRRRPPPRQRHAEGSEGEVIRDALGMALARSEEHTSELQSQSNLVCRLLLEKKKKKIKRMIDDCDNC